MSLPPAMQRRANEGFARWFGVDVSEARDPIDAYPNLQSFFTRHLRKGTRPVDAAPEAFVSPCDGRWGASGRIEDGRLLQVKGIDYALADLLGDPLAATAYEGGSFATLYLSPRDYHRFHTPLRAHLVRADHLPGRLWPVNDMGLEGVPGLFTLNERICAYFEPDPSGRVVDPGEREIAPLCIVAVGATMVGSVHLRDDDLTTNRPGASRVRREFPDGGIPYEKAEEWGHFAFGSTLVVVAAADILVLESEPPGTALRLGTRIGRLKRPGDATASPAIA